MSRVSDGAVARGDKQLRSTPSGDVIVQRSSASKERADLSRKSHETEILDLSSNCLESFGDYLSEKDEDGEIEQDDVAKPISSLIISKELEKNWWKSFHKLTTLTLSHNRIHHIGPTLALLESLTSIDLSHNLLEDLPLSLSSLTSSTSYCFKISPS